MSTSMFRFFHWHSTSVLFETITAKYLFTNEIYGSLQFLCFFWPVGRWRDIEIANKSLDILMNHFGVFINFPIRNDLARLLMHHNKNVLKVSLLHRAVAVLKFMLCKIELCLP